MDAPEKMTTSSSQRAKVYRLNDDGKWDDQGTGHVAIDYLEGSEELGLFVVDEEDNETLLVHRISSDDIYRKQEDTIITWRDSEFSSELALSFQKTTGCSYIWDHICNVQRNLHYDTLHTAKKLRIDKGKKICHSETIMSTPPITREVHQRETPVATPVPTATKLTKNVKDPGSSYPTPLFSVEPGYRVDDPMKDVQWEKGYISSIGRHACVQMAKQKSTWGLSTSLDEAVIAFIHDYPELRNRVTSSEERRSAEEGRSAELVKEVNNLRCSVEVEKKKASEALKRALESEDQVAALWIENACLSRRLKEQEHVAKLSGLEVAALGDQVKKLTLELKEGNVLREHLEDLRKQAD